MTTTEKTLKAAEKFGMNQIVLAGGVAANSDLRKKIKSLAEKGYKIYIPAMKYCTDNAAMIGAAGYYAYKLGRRAGLDLNAKASDKLN